MGWVVQLTDEAEVQLVSDLQAGLITRDDVAVMKKWIEEVEEKGIEVAQRNPSWRDHEHEGKWTGHNAISFSYQGRLIYRLERQRVVVKVVKVTHDHDYS